MPRIGLVPATLFVALAAASSASAAPGLDALSSLGGLRRGEPFALRLTASDPARPISGLSVDFGEPGSATGESACRTGAPSGPFRLGAPASFAVPYVFATSGVHLITIRVLAGGCDGDASSTLVRRVAAVSLPTLPLPPVLAAAARRRGCRDANLMPRRGVGTRIRAATLCLVNRQRARAGLSPLRRNPALQHAASVHSLGIVRSGAFAHGSVVSRLRAAGYAAAGSVTTGENLAFGFGTQATPAQTLGAWMRSPTHRANILSGRFREAGIGLALGIPGNARHGATYTMDFGAGRAS